MPATAHHARMPRQGSPQTPQSRQEEQMQSAQSGQTFCGTNRHAPVPVQLYLSRSSESFAAAAAPVLQAAALAAEAATGCVTQMPHMGRSGS